MDLSVNANLKYIKFYLIILLLLCSPLIINYFFLKRSGEFLNPKQIYELQQSPSGNDIIYGSAIFDSIEELKLYSFSKIKPKFIAFGSSRVLQIRKSFFNSSFYNLGYMTRSIQEALEIAPRILELHTPEVVLIGVDFWWFNEKYADLKYNSAIKKNSNTIDPAHMLKPFEWLKDRKITFNQYIKLQSKKVNNIEIRAITKNSGIAADGSYYYTSTITTNDPEFKDFNFYDTKQRIKDGTNKFHHGSVASELHFNKFIEMIELFKSKGVNVILFFPPLAPNINETMKDYNYSYIDDLKNKFKSANIKIYDFTNPVRTITTNDCEFIDGFHGGDVIYAKILKDIANNEPSMAPYVKLDYLETVNQNYSGLAMIPNQKITKNPEIDFLQMQCKKTII